MAKVYAYCQRRQIEHSIPYKFTLGMFSCSVGFMILYASRYAHDLSGMISPSWLLASYLFQSLGEILVSALGVAMIAELVPAPLMGFMMGMWFLTSSLSGFTGAALASLTALPKDIDSGVDSLMRYTQVFMQIGVTTFIAGCIMGILAPFLSRLMINPKVGH